MKIFKMHHRKQIISFLPILITTIMVIWSGLSATVHAAPDQAILEAQRAIDNAWEVYHQAALSGTIASPAIQNQIEAELDKVRNLMTRARDMEKKNPHRLGELLKKIEKLAQEIIAASTMVKP